MNGNKSAAWVQNLVESPGINRVEEVASLNANMVWGGYVHAGVMLGCQHTFGHVV